MLKPILRLWQSKVKEKVSRRFLYPASLRKCMQSGLFISIDMLVALYSVLISRLCVDCLLV